MRAFLFVFASLVTIHVSSAAQAQSEPSSATPTVECLSKVSGGSKAIAKEARDVVQALEADVKNQLKKHGEVNIGMGERDRAKDAELILSALDKLQAKRSLDASEGRIVNALCESDLSVDLAVSL